MKSKYFAYGSNMKAQRLRGRAPSAATIGTAELRGHEMIVNKMGSDASTKANIVPVTGGSVLGVLYELNDEDLCALDKIEAGYDRVKVKVEMNKASISEAWTYISGLTVDGVEPFCWYMAHVVEGAVENNLPIAYVDKLRKIRCRKS